ncbi:Retrovirus-related Pol polyprotein from transposon RE1 [Linum perenne]
MVLSDLIRAETRIKTQAQIDGSAVDGGNAFAARPSRGSYPSHRPSYLTPRPHFGAANPSDIRCRHCGESGHSQSTCRKRNYYNYCKRPRYIITDCRAYSPKGFGPPYGSASYNTYPAPAPSSISSVASSSGALSSEIQHLVHEAIQQSLPTALNAAFAAFGVSGNSKLWHLDSACFNHMTGSASGFQNYRPLRNASVQVANGHTLPIVGIGDIKTATVSLPNTLHVPSIVPNLVSVGQLTDNGYVVSFFSSGCSVQDQRTRRHLGQGSKVGRSFFLESFPIDARKDDEMTKKAGVLELQSQDSLGFHCFSSHLSTVNKWNI